MKLPPVRFTIGRMVVVVAIMALALSLRSRLTLDMSIRASVLPVLILFSVFLTYWLERLTTTKPRPRKNAPTGPTLGNGKDWIG
jgi:hypothetical protein